MTIKQHGGIFGRNPTYYNAEIENNLQVSGTSNLDGSVVINESGADVDFRIESDTNTHAFFLNGANGNTGVGTSSPSALFQVGVPLTSTGGIRVSGSNLNVDAGYQSLNVNGTQAAPALIIGGDANTGFFHPASDTLAVSTAAVERLRFEPAGNITVSNGNLVIGTSGKGIDFSATAGTGTSELFDDYEEGEFAVTVTPGTSGSVTLNSSFDTGSYTKVGNLVTVTGFVAVSSVSSPVGLFKINLPITPAASTDRAADSSASVTMQSVVSANCADFLGTVNENDPYLYIQLGDGSTLQNDSAQQLQANTYIIFSATYRGA